jgi:cytochrome c551/c552
MDLLTKLILPPELSHITVVSGLTLFVTFIFTAFLALAMGSTALSLALRPLDQNLSRHVADVIPGKLRVWFALGVLPLATLAFQLGQTIQGTAYHITDCLAQIAPLALAGMLAMSLYRRNLNRFFGAVGVLATLAFALPYVALLDRLNRPEMWPLIQPLAPDIYNIQGLSRAAVFLTGAMLVTGAGVLFINFIWAEKKLAADAPHAVALQNWALGLTLAGAFGLTATVVWDAAILPFGARSWSNLKFVLTEVVLIWVVGLLTLNMLLHQHRRRVLAVSVLAFVVFGIELGRQQVVWHTAISDKLALQRLNAQAAFALRGEAQEKRYASNLPVDPKFGEKVYNERCASCHAFDQKIVGPPHNSVLPKYVGAPDKLLEYILNPTKVDPNYPAMPKLGLSRREARAVADYLLKHGEEKKP